MKNNLFSRYNFLKEYLQITYKSFPDDSLVEDLKEEDPARYQEIRDAESEFARLEIRLKCEQRRANTRRIRQSRDGENQIQQPDLFANLSAALPSRPKQSKKQSLKASTIFTPLPCVVSEGYDKIYRGINWPHYENMLKLFALDEYFIQGIPTLQQEIDRRDLVEAIKTVGNAKYKKKELTAEEIIKRKSGVYMRYGRNVIRAMAEMDPIVSERCLKDLRSEYFDTRNDNNSRQLHKMMSKARTIFMKLQSRYRVRD